MDEVDEICARVAIMRRGKLAFDGPISELRSRAGHATRHLVTTDDASALTVCQATRGVVDAAREGARIAFDADDETVERLSRTLVDGGLGIQSLHAPTSALETLFFRLTDNEDPNPQEVAA